MPSKIMTCEIIGKENYKGYKSITEIKVISADISQGTISLSDKQYSSKANIWKLMLFAVEGTKDMYLEIESLI